MNKTLYLIGSIVFMMLLSAASCKTTEENYKAAYDIAVKKQESGAGRDVSSYISRERRLNEYKQVGTDSVRIVIEHVSVVDGPVNNAKKYGVVVGEFKQVFNARSYRDRINNAENSPETPAFVVMNAMKQYYVIYRSFDTKTGAATFMKNKGNFKINTQTDEVWILEMLRK